MAEELDEITTLVRRLETEAKNIAVDGGDNFYKYASTGKDVEKSYVRFFLESLEFLKPALIEKFQKYWAQLEDHTYEGSDNDVLALMAYFSMSYPKSATRGVFREKVDWTRDVSKWDVTTLVTALRALIFAVFDKIRLQPSEQDNSAGAAADFGAVQKAAKFRNTTHHLEKAEVWDDEFEPIEKELKAAASALGLTGEDTDKKMKEASQYGVYLNVTVEQTAMELVASRRLIAMQTCEIAWLRQKIEQITSAATEVEGIVHSVMNEVTKMRNIASEPIGVPQFDPID